VQKGAATLSPTWVGEHFLPTEIPPGGSYLIAPFSPRLFFREAGKASWGASTCRPRATRTQTTYTSNACAPSYSLQPPPSSCLAYLTLSIVCVFVLAGGGLWVLHVSCMVLVKSGSGCGIVRELLQRQLQLSQLRLVPGLHVWQLQPEQRGDQ
jgi:hypothetical protein